MYTLSIPEMYSSWWFLGLLTLFSLNLITCSIERIPTVWKLVKKDNLETAPARLLKMKPGQTFSSQLDQQALTNRVVEVLGQKKWVVSQREKEGGTLLFAQKGPWTRFGVYLVHTSILVILFGAIVGSPGIANKIFNASHYAFKGYAEIPETESTSAIYNFGTQEMLDLGFTVRCDLFDIEYYSSGMPKEYLSRLTVLENGEEVYKTTIEVNTPLIYKGVTFYQSSYKPYDDFLVEIENSAGVKKTQLVRPASQVFMDEVGATFGIINVEYQGEAVSQIKVWFNDNGGEPSVFWIDSGRQAVLERPSGNYHFMAKQRYATGLQVAKDPGVWVVYLGCCLMLIGLVVAFFMSHRKIWAFIREEEGQVSVVFAGNANKNKLDFEKTFTELISPFSEAEKATKP